MRGGGVGRGIYFRAGKTWVGLGCGGTVRYSVGDWDGLTIDRFIREVFGGWNGFELPRRGSVLLGLKWWWLIPLVEISAAAFVPAAAPL